MKKILSFIFVASLVLPVGGAVFAQENPADTQDETTISNEATRAEQARANAQNRAGLARLGVQERISQIKQRVEERRAQIRQEVCERRQERLNTVIPNLARGATAVKGTLDKVYERVQGFYDSGQLTVENYDELKSNVDTAKTEAEAALEALTDYEFELDCDNPNAAQQLDGFREAVGQARDALKNYRDQLVVLISSMRAAVAEANSNNSETEEQEANPTGAGDEESANSEGGTDEE